MGVDELHALYALALQAIGGFSSQDRIRLLMRLKGDEVSSLGEMNSWHQSQSETYSEVPALSEKDWNDALRSYDRCLTSEVTVLPINSAAYPASLRAIDDPPPILFARGSVSLLKEVPGVAVVGTRKMTRNGATIARRISGFMASEGWIVVSGLALGIDAEAHRGCLDAGGKTIAVLAHGLEKPQPARNADLGYEILDTGGLWVSEHAVGVPAKPHQFVTRNRIQLGLSAGSIIVECEPKSGSIKQAQFCIKQKRPLFAVLPHDPMNSLGLLCSGPELLVNKYGAIPLRTRSDYPHLLSYVQAQREMMNSLA